jgi:epoxyqueuosine reductase
LDYRDFLQQKNILIAGGSRLPQELRGEIGLPFAISFVVPLPDAVIDEIVNGPTKTYFHHYRTCNMFIDQTAFALVQALMGEGYQAMYVPASQSISEDGFRGLISHKAVACLAGLGGIGDNDLFITEQYGCRVRLGTVLTDFPADDGKIVPNPCIHCGRCVKACPCGALTGEKWNGGDCTQSIIDVSKCSFYMKQAYQKIGRGAVCGICMAVCPIGQKNGKLRG